MVKIQEIIMIALAMSFGNFLAGLLGADELGIRLRDWLFRKKE